MSERRVVAAGNTRETTTEVGAQIATRFLIPWEAEDWSDHDDLVY